MHPFRFNLRTGRLPVGRIIRKMERKEQKPGKDNWRLVKMLDTYKMIQEKDVMVGQTSAGVWYCKELHASDPREAGKLMGEMNRELNKVNKTKKVSPEPPSKKEKDSMRYDIDVTATGSKMIKK